MNYTYERATGKWTQLDKLLGYGYSGNGEGLNNPEMSNVKSIGPLPKGWYTIGIAYHNKTKGELTMNLTPDKDNEMYGRAYFELHGDNKLMNRTASDGCIVLARMLRDLISRSKIVRLQVI